MSEKQSTPDAPTEAKAVDAPPTSTEAPITDAAGNVVREEIPKEISAKVALLQQMFDVDKDGFLNQEEMSALSNKTSGKEGAETMSDEEWRMLCMVLSIDYTKGLAWTDLIIVYTKLAEQFGADLSKDFEICFPNCELSKR